MYDSPFGIQTSRLAELYRNGAMTAVIMSWNPNSDLMRRADCWQSCFERVRSWLAKHGRVGLGELPAAYGPLIRDGFLGSQDADDDEITELILWLEALEYARCARLQTWSAVHCPVWSQCLPTKSESVTDSSSSPKHRMTLQDLLATSGESHFTLHSVTM